MTNNIFSIQDLADFVGGEVSGDGQVAVAGVADLQAATQHEISFLLKSGHASLLAETAAGAVVIPVDTETDLPAIKVKNPALAITLIHRKFLEKEFVSTGIHPSVVIGEKCYISKHVSIGPHVVFADNVTIGERVSLEPGVVVGDGVVIGDDVTIMANVVIRYGCKIGNRVIIQSGSVIGSDGYGYVQDAHGRHVKRPHVGIVVLEDDVEIGANSCVDRATFGVTVIKQGAKVDNLVQVAHNVTVGEGCLLVAQCGIAGSTSLGRGVVLGGQVAVTDHVTLGDGVMVGGKAGVAGNVPAGSVVSGYPAIDHRTWLRASSVFSKLPQLVKDVRDLTKKIANLDEKNK
ncbi:MAG: UDP-3-O-(3-hydroxymyristoyl)glucosamine N-acyltransferase [Proteobacteria bacterium]|nr:UDP-3-O-(3-hydroxymyristoyl)glucosamine N-acyltransferase [Pseudomonadota bacterium]MBU1640321.1 UDP-3-O-(3-hydroxymyristoyl)glucosamine N-acyltransferase [Pseudomonadota bacterium]